MQLYDAANEKAHVVYLDETVFKGRDFTKHAYSMPKTKLVVYDRLKYQVYQSVCLAICECHGLLAMNQKDKSFDNDSFFEMLESIRDAASDEKKIYVMLDNARFHGLDED